ncbi:MAG: hypothetical protein QW757_01625 [Candidatus Woesearchaeota archaeon]
MTGNKLEKDIIEIFNRDISSFYTINQISKKLNKAYPYINNKVNSLIKEGILTKIVAGKSYLCTINLDSEKAIALLTLNEAEKKEKEIKNKKIKNIISEIKEIKNKFSIYTILYYNSFNEKENEKETLKETIIFVLDYINDKEAIKNSYPILNKFNLIFFEIDSFENYLVKNYHLISKFIVLYSYEKYYEILNEIKNKLLLKNKEKV